MIAAAALAVAITATIILINYFNDGSPAILRTPAQVTSITFSPDGKTLASASADGTVQTWDPTDHKLIRTLGSTRQKPRSLAFGLDGTTLAAGGGPTIVAGSGYGIDDQTPAPAVLLRDLGTGAPYYSFDGYTETVNSVKFSSDRKTLATGGENGSVRLWDVSGSDGVKPIEQPLVDRGEPINSVTFSPDGKILASGGGDRMLRFWDVVTRTPIGQPVPTSKIWALDFSPDGLMLASGESDGAHLWDVAKHTQIGELLPGQCITDAFSPNGKLLATGSGANYNVQLWEVAVQRRIGEPLTGHSELVRTVAFSPDGKTLASGSYDKSVRLWEVPSVQ